MPWILIPAGVITALGLTSVRGIWRAPTSYEHLQQPPAWWMWGSNGWRAWLRTLPLCVFGALALVLVTFFGWLARVHSMQSEKAALNLLVFLLGLILSALLFLIATVAVYNRPRFAVPHRFRADRGLAATGKPLWRRH
jgi:hypothetical protein